MGSPLDVFLFCGFFFGLGRDGFDGPYLILVWCLGGGVFSLFFLNVLFLEWCAQQQRVFQGIWKGIWRNNWLKMFIFFLVCDCLFMLHVFSVLQDMGSHFTSSNCETSTDIKFVTPLKEMSEKKKSTIIIASTWFCITLPWQDVKQSKWTIVLALGFLEKKHLKQKTWIIPMPSHQIFLDSQFAFRGQPKNGTLGCSPTKNIRKKTKYLEWYIWCWRRCKNLQRIFEFLCHGSHKRQNYWNPFLWGYAPTQRYFGPKFFERSFMKLEDACAKREGTCCANNPSEEPPHMLL